MEQFWQIFWSIVGLIATAMTTWLIGVITNYFNSKIEDKTAQKHITTLMEIIRTSVMEINQTYVDDMKSAGTFNEEAQKKALEKCQTIVMAKLTPELRTYITNNFGDISTHIKSLIEATIYQLKK